MFYHADRGQDDKDTTPGGVHPQMSITASPLLMFIHTIPHPQNFLQKTDTFPANKYNITA
jgi:hypothetical protein